MFRLAPDHWTDARLQYAFLTMTDAARDRLVPLVYDELRRLAQHYLRGERAGHTLQATALVNEAYLRLAEIDRMAFRDRTHFFAMAATVMRRVLVDYARERARGKRGGGVAMTTLDDRVPAADPPVDVVALDRALERLTALDTRQARIVELRFFGGLTVDETAAALDISTATVKREWASAKAWLYVELNAT
jgi:RNA polymerase sigma factor (TIGR02999 family)